MPATKIKIGFGTLVVHDTGDTFGSGTWKIDARVDGQQLGDPNKEYIVPTDAKLALNWSAEVDVSDKVPGDKVEATLAVTEIDSVSDDDLGTVRLAFKFPFENEIDYPLAAPDGKRFFTVESKMEILEGFSEEPLDGTTPVGRAPEGDDSEGAVSGDLVIPRVEICPVVPVMSKDQMPPRPKSSGVGQPGKETPQCKPVPLSGSQDLNALANPSLIPILDPSDPSDPQFAKRVARIAITFMRPANLDKDKLVWLIKKGDIKFHGSTKGKTEVLVYGTKDSASDSMAEIEVRWETKDGPLLSLYRAHVGRVKGIPFRATIVSGSHAGTSPPLTAADVTPRVKVADVERHVRLANVLLYQSGLMLVPDPNASAYEAAVAAPGKPGIFTLQLPMAQNGVTVGVDTNIAPDAMRLNCNPGVMHLVYIKKTKKSLAGSAVDRPGLSGSDQTMSGTPSSSWLSPSGVLPDKAAGTVTMNTMPASKKRDRQSDKDFLTARNTADKSRTLTVADFDKLWGVIMPDYTGPADPDWPQTVAHEVGHVLGLLHRGMTDFDKKTTGHGSADGVDDPTGKGHPWLENVMCYSGARAQDLDLIQTDKIRTHAVNVFPIPKPAGPPPPPPPPPPKPKTGKLEELQGILGVPQTGVWDAATESAAANKMVRYGTKGPIVGWVQTRLNEAGMNSGTVDEISGSVTTGAIGRYQDSKPDLSTDKVAGPRTMQSLAGA